jgi:autotransporter-associated beta strand protein
LSGNNTVGGLIQLASGGGTALRVDAGTLTLNGNVNILTNTSSGTLTLGGAGNGFANGIIDDGSSANVPNTNILALTKTGVGTWTLTNANTYSDVTTISAGTLALGVSGSIGNSSSINVQGAGIFDVSAVTGGWSLGASGGKSIKGSGNIVGNTAINGKITPGDPLVNAPIGTLTFGNNLTLAGSAVLEINRTNTPANADKIVLVGAGTLAFGGTLTVTNVGPTLLAGDSFTLLSAATKTGTFAVTNLPTLGTGLAWSNSLATDGKITVVSTGPQPQPGITGISFSGTSLVISGTNGTSGQQFTELSSTNLSLALTNWTPVLTNIFGSGNFNITNTVNPSAPQSFYILRLP